MKNVMKAVGNILLMAIRATLVVLLLGTVFILFTSKTFLGIVFVSATAVVAVKGLAALTFLGSMMLGSLGGLLRFIGFGSFFKKSANGQSVEDVLKAGLGDVSIDAHTSGPMGGAAERPAH